MQTLSNGYQKPETGDRGNVFSQPWKVIFKELMIILMMEITLKS